MENNNYDLIRINTRILNMLKDWTIVKVKGVNNNIEENKYKNLGNEEGIQILANFNYFSRWAKKLRNYMGS